MSPRDPTLSEKPGKTLRLSGFVKPESRNVYWADLGSSFSLRMDFTTVVAVLLNEKWTLLHKGDSPHTPLVAGT